MITFGGAGPVHAARLCEKLGIARFLVPPGAGVGSAIGFLRAPFGFEAARSAFMRLADFDAAALNALVASLTAEAVAFARQGMGEAEPLLEQTAYMRYSGQGWEIPVEVGAAREFVDDDRLMLKERFELPTGASSGGRSTGSMPNWSAGRCARALRCRLRSRSP